MFEEIKDNFYKSLSESIKNRKKDLKLKRENILSEKTRVSKIVNAIRNEHHPYLIGSGEYPYLYYLFLCEDHDSFINKDIFNTSIDDHEKINGKNYDKMLWEHIDWDKMFQDVITELSKFDRSEGLGENFENTLVDYVPYAVIKYDKVHFDYGRKKIFDEEIERKRQSAIEWVHLRHGSRLFKQTFYKKFSGKVLREFDKNFPEFVHCYLEERKPNQYSLGLQAYNILNNTSGFAALWQKLPEVQYGDMPDGGSDLEKLLRKYVKNGRKQIKKIKKYQQKFDAFNIDIK